MRQLVNCWDMRSGGRGANVRIHAGFVGQRDRHIRHRAIAHGDAFGHACSVMLPSFPKNSAHVDGGAFHFQPECHCAVFVNDRQRRSRVDHEGGPLIVNRNRNEKMITEPPLQFRASKSLPGK